MAFSGCAVKPKLGCLRLRGEPAYILFTGDASPAVDRHSTTHCAWSRSSICNFRTWHIKVVRSIALAGPWIRQHPAINSSTSMNPCSSMSNSRKRLRASDTLRSMDLKYASITGLSSCPSNCSHVICPDSLIFICSTISRMRLTTVTVFSSRALAMADSTKTPVITFSIARAANAMYTAKTRPMIAECLSKGSDASLQLTPLVMDW
mmetsp:Transcript_66139/g.108918  ORF Transcript_66139/g.108918 Transcript_66139/m.108918 type:complete len:206 (-) Transcript_66139:1336-1953(-)